MANTAQALITAAIGLGYAGLSDRDLKECLLFAAQSSGGGGGNNDSQGTVDPVAAPADPTKTAFYLNTTTHSIWGWNVTSQTWVS